MTLIQGVDVSKYQDPKAVPWKKLVLTRNVQFAFMRSGVGTTLDPRFREHVSMARDNGVPVIGSYHAVKPSKPVDVQVDALVGCCDHDVAPAVDVEILDGQPREAVAEFALRFVEAVEARLLKRCVFYTYPYFVLGLPLSASLGSRPLWIAHYDVRQPLVPKPWDDWTIWQHDGTNGLRAPGGLDLDFNVYRGTIEQLRQELLQPITADA